MKNARFWDYINGSDVKITLRPGQQLHHFKAEPTEEGWTSALNVWKHEGDRVTLLSKHDGVDCDGRLAGGGECWCAIDDLAAREVDGVKFPDWHEGDRWQRDYQAEAAGY